MARDVTWGNVLFSHDRWTKRTNLGYYCVRLTTHIHLTFFVREYKICFYILKDSYCSCSSFYFYLLIIFFLFKICLLTLKNSLLLKYSKTLKFDMCSIACINTFSSNTFRFVCMCMRAYVCVCADKYAKNRKTNI